MQTLVFNTTTKKVVLLSGRRGDSSILETFDNVSTVKCLESGFYEIMQKQDEESNNKFINKGSFSSIPVMRVPIANTNMIIEK
jgi:hypothetical protein